jgi:thymidylate kinase
MDAENGDAHSLACRPFLVTFSGIDGAGKTTQIERLVASLRERGLNVTVLSFWDDVAVWSRMRSGVGYRAADLLHSSQMADVPIPAKNHKHIRKWYLTAIRSFFYVLDVVRLRRLLGSRRVRSFDVVIFDRYIYDQIANIYAHSLLARLYSRALLKLTPIPDLAFIVDASPDAAFARKPEYPLEFLYRNRHSFLQLRKFAPELTVISNGNAEEMEDEIQSYVLRSSIRKTAAYPVNAGISEGSTVVLKQPCPKVQNQPTTAL